MSASNSSTTTVRPDAEFVTLREAAAQLRMSVRTLRRRVRDGLVTVSQRGSGPILLHREVLYAALEMRRRGEI